ncbi:MAG: hypothetical protein CM1200mP27_06950 [Chloroflexota bacterium]|nr:MAG: hypothetical protein CM1200mP27_06950 [Chloroflexota bacterium]
MVIATGPQLLAMHLGRSADTSCPVETRTEAISAVQKWTNSLVHFQRIRVTLRREIACNALKAGNEETASIPVMFPTRLFGISDSVEWTSGPRPPDYISSTT